MPVAFEGSSTPVSKKLSRLQDSRDQWKTKYSQLKLRIRVVEEQARWLSTNRDQWKAKAEALQAQLADEKK
jgi:hypothetical protein